MARDFYHNQVREALETDGWKITHDPYEMTVDTVGYEIDLGAEPLIAAEKGGEKIAVEIKSFIGPSTITEFHRAVGQFNDYFVAMETVEPERVLYLAVPENIYRNFFQKPVIQRSIARIGGKIIVYDPAQQKIVSWIK
ncbi:MAG: XisH family protein [Lewinellaceae bacterium]|nr:XisH family protein [Phaeodactylibacter sp.]MCB9039839.1 XisH family protein [Lewinellaceae bacterium]